MYERLEKNPPPWTDRHTMIVRQIKKYVKQLPYIVIPSPDTFKIVETDAFDIGYGGILKQVAKMMPKNKLLDFILALGQLPSRITALLRKKFYLSYYVFQNSKMILLIKSF